MSIYLTIECHALARLAGCLLIKRDVIIEFLLLGGNLGRVVLALGPGDLQIENLELELEDLVLYLAVL